MSRPPSPSRAVRPTSTSYEQTSFRFLDLPPELRAYILAICARTEGTARLKRNSGGRLSTTDSTSLANKQIRHEYLGVLYEHAQTTVAYVLDFDFRHVVTYLNKLNVAEAKALPTKEPGDSFKSHIPGFSRKHVSASGEDVVKDADSSAPEPRTLKFLFDFTPKCIWQETYLFCGLDRLDAAHKTGSNARVEYGVFSDEAARKWEKRHHFDWLVGADWLTEKQTSEMKEMKWAINKATRTGWSLSALAGFAP